MSPTDVTRTRRRWLVLGLGVLAQTSSSAFVYGMGVPDPGAARTYGLSLTEAGTYVAAPTAGLLVALIARGAAADRWGERVVISVGLTLSAAAIAAVALLPDLGDGDARRPGRCRRLCGRLHPRRPGPTGRGRPSPRSARSPPRHGGDEPTRRARPDRRDADQRRLVIDFSR